MDNNSVQALLGYLSQPGPDGRSFADMLRDRRNFVQSGEDKLSGQVANDLSTGTPISPATANANLNQFYTTNASGTSNLINNILQTAVANTQAQNDAYFKQQDLGLQKHASDREDFLSGFGDSGSGTSVLDLHAQNIKNGTETLQDVPQELRPRVADKLTQSGYDPAKAANSLIDQLEQEYNGKSTGETGKPLAFGNDPIRHLAELLGIGASKIGVNTSYNKQQNSYNSIKQAFQSELGKLSGTNSRLNPKVIEQLSSSLPSENDPADVAQRKFQFLRTQLNNVFYPGGKPTSISNSGSSSGSKYTIVEVK